MEHASCKTTRNEIAIDSCNWTCIHGLSLSCWRDAWRHPTVWWLLLALLTFALLAFAISFPVLVWVPRQVWKTHMPYTSRQVSCASVDELWVNLTFDVLSCSLRLWRYHVDQVMTCYFHILPYSSREEVILRTLQFERLVLPARHADLHSEWNDTAMLAKKQEPLEKNWRPCPATTSMPAPAQNSNTVRPEHTIKTRHGVVVSQQVNAGNYKFMAGVKITRG